MTTELKYTLLRLAKVFRGGPEVYINKIDEDLADEIEEMLKDLDPKYDPCRLLKKGDIVKYSPKLGRAVPRTPKGIICTVLNDELRDGCVYVKYVHEDETFTEVIPFFFFELVTPVEEREQFYVEENCGEWRVLNTKSNLIASVYNGLGHPNAKEAAEAECSRLNAEHRKENA